MFWDSVGEIINNGFSEEGLDKLEKYAELFSQGELIFKRFTSQEQRGCTAGGTTHVIASIIAGAEAPADCFSQKLSDFQRELKQGSYQAEIIQKWGESIGIWIDNTDALLESRLGEFISEGGEAKVYDNGIDVIKSIGLDYFIQPIHALDRITLHNTYFPETKLTVLGFGKDEKGEFKIIASQPFIEGYPMSEEEIEAFATSIGFTLKNKRNWTYSTPYIYLSDLHDENVIKSKLGNIYVIDCDIRLNTPNLKAGGIRIFTNEVEFVNSK